MYFRVVVESPGRSVPWIDETANFGIAGGLEPGETREWTLEPNMYSGNWDQKLPEDTMLSIELMRIDGPDGEPVYEMPSSEEELESQRAELEKKLEAI